MDKKIFKADKVSGFEGNPFLFSVVLPSFFSHDINHKFRFNFWAATIDISTQKMDEWIKWDIYTKETDKILNFVNKEGASYFENLAAKISEDSTKFKTIALEFLEGIHELSNEELIKRFEKFADLYIEYFGPGFITFIYEIILSERLHKSMSRFDNCNDLIHHLLKTDYKSFIYQNEEQLILIKKETDKIKKDFLVDQYLKDYFFMNGSGYVYAPVLTKSAVESLSSAVKEHNTQIVSHDQFEEVELTEEEKNIIKLLKPTEIIHDLRKKINLIGAFVMCRFLEELVRRTNVEINLATKIFWTEYKDMILNTQEVLKKIKNREKISLVYEGGELHYLDYLAVFKREDNDNKEKVCKGTPASKGKSQGLAKIIIGKSDFHKFNEGEILITEMTRPDFVVLMKKAAAIVTDEGGLTSHAAIVSRELHIPCIVGTRSATETFKDGDLVEVDADNGIVKILKNEK